MKMRPLGWTRSSRTGPQETRRFGCTEWYQDAHTQSDVEDMRRRPRQKASEEPKPWSWTSSLQNYWLSHAVCGTLFCSPSKVVHFSLELDCNFLGGTTSVFLFFVSCAQLILYLKFLFNEAINSDKYVYQNSWWLWSVLVAFLIQIFWKKFYLSII